MPSDASDGYAGIRRSKPRRKPKPKPPVTGSRGDSAAERKAPTPSGRHRTPRVTPTPPADVKSERDLKRGDTVKRSKSYRGAIREAYSSKPVAERRERAKQAKARKNYFDRTIAKTHKDRSERLRELRRSAAQHDVVTDRDLKTAREYLEAHGPKLSEAEKTVLRVREEQEKERLKPEGFLDKAAETSTSLVMRPAAIAAATYHDPVGVPVKTVKQGVGILKGAPGALLETALHPKKELSKAVEEFAGRGAETFGETVKRVRKEGAAADIADVAVVVPTGGVVAKALRVKAKPRPKKRISGNVRKEQRASRGLVVRGGQTLVDRQRARKAERQLQEAEAGGKPVALEVEVAARANRAAERVVEVPARRSGTHQKRAVAKTKSRAVQLLKNEQARVIRAAAKTVNRLNKHERRALYYVSAGIAPADRAGFAQALGERSAKIQAKRTEEGVQPQGTLKRTDELKTIDRVVADADKIDFGKVKAVTDQLRDLTIKVGREDPALNAGQRLHRRYAQQAETLGLRQGELPDADIELKPGEVSALKHFDEPTADYIRRVQQTAEKANLERPLYFPSERYSLDVDPDYSAYAAGGSRMGRQPFRYQGKNFKLGLQDTSPQVLLHGLARNIKRKHNWNLVAKTFDQHTFDGLRNMSVKALRGELAKRGIDLSTVAFWNPGTYSRRVAEELDSDMDAHRTELDELRHGAPEEFGMERIANVLTDSAMTMDRAVVHPDANVKGWSVVPRAAYDEITASAKPSGFLGRTADIVKQKSSRYILGSLNLPWMQYQIASNALLTGLAGAGPVTFARAQLFWRKLTPEERDSMNALLGSGSFSDTLQKTHIGAANAGVLQGIVNAYRGLKKAEVWDKAHVRKLNPLDAMFAFDRKQNDLFRRTVLYNEQRREAFHRMGENMGVIDRLQNRLTSIMALDPGDQLKAMRREPELLEKHADAVDKWLGDYTTFTHAERRSLQRFVMFYGFMRFSLNFTFYTMPIEHPLMSGIIGNLGLLEAEEVNELFGGNAPPWAEGKFYFTKDGKLQEVPLSKMNPALNAFAELRHPAQITTIAPPYVSLIAEQLVNKNLFAGRDWRIKGKPASYGANWRDYPVEERARIAADDVMSMLFPYRVGETMTQEGPQGDDSLLWDERQTEYKKKETKKGIKKDIAFEKNEEDFIDQIVPLLPQPTRDVEKFEEIEAGKRTKPKGKAAPKPFGSSGSGGKRYGVKG